MLDLSTESVSFFGAICVSDKNKIVVVGNVVLFEKLDHFGNGFLSADRFCDDADFALRGEFENGIDVHDHAEKRGKRGNSAAVAQIDKVADNEAMVSVELVVFKPLCNLFHAFAILLHLLCIVDEQAFTACACKRIDHDDFSVGIFDAQAFCDVRYVVEAAAHTRRKTDVKHVFALRQNLLEHHFRIVRIDLRSFDEFACFHRILVVFFVKTIFERK